MKGSSSFLNIVFLNKIPIKNAIITPSKYNDATTKPLCSVKNTEANNA